MSDIIIKEKEERCERDISVMAELEATLSHIQTVIIDNFGTGGEVTDRP